MNHVYVDNSFEKLKEFGNDSVDLILTDVPYDLNTEQKIYLHTEFCRISRGSIIVFSPPENQWILPANEYGFWVKPISTKNTSKSYSRFVEMIFFYHKDKKVWNADRHWSQYTNVFTDLVDDSRIHPYRKPISLLQRLIRNHSNEWDLVLDPFFGSGSVGEACILNNRTYIGIEIDEKYREFWSLRLGI